MKATPQKVTCPYYEKKRDPRDEEFPNFCKDLFFSAFPAPIPDRRIDDDIETDHSEFFKPMASLGSGRLGKTFTVLRKDFTKYACTIVKKQDPRMLVAMTKIDSKKIDYVDAIRATQPFVLDEKEYSPFICPILLRFKSRLPYQVEHYYFISEYWHNGTSLCQHLQTVGRLPENVARFYLVELADALVYIHQKGKILRRLSLCALLIEPYGHLKLAPYCLCEQNLDCGQPCNMLVRNCGDQFYAAPEIVFGVDVHFAADWWSYGVIMYQLLTGQLPFTGRTLGDLGKAITECSVEIPDFVSGEAAALIKHLLHKDPRRRLGFSDDVNNGSESGSVAVKNHPFFQNILWRNVRNTLLTPPMKFEDFKGEVDVIRARNQKNPVDK
ncbi:protein kinase C iota type-like isoform X2 [Physella acuta]|nr:protein kinase C iota type-like isoform X2 [Physella acuta]